MSERAARRLSRILAMLPWVLAHPEEATVDEVCTRFGYEPRELAKDLDLIMVCGLPGYLPHDLMYASVVGDDVVVESADYFAGARRLTPAEGLTLLSAALATDAAGAGSPALRSAADKLARVLLPGEGVVAVEVADDPGLVPLLREAVADGRRLRITYWGVARDEVTEREVDPWQVFTDLGRWYLDALDHRSGEYRRFRVDRIVEATETGEAAGRPDELPDPEVAYAPGADDVRAVISLAPEARWVAEYYPVTVLGEDGDRLRVEFSAAGTAVPARLLLRLGPSATLESGDEVRAALDELRAALLERYRPS